MKSPCLDCEYKDESKLFHPACEACEKRLDYVAALGNMSHSVPIELTDLVKGKEVDMTEAQSTWQKPEAPKTKTCRGEVCRTICADGVERPLAEFGPKSGTPDSLQYACRMCLAYTVHKSKLKKEGVTPDPAAYADTYKTYGRGGSPAGTGKARPEKPAAAPEKPDAAEASGATDKTDIVEVDFSRVPGALAAIETAAADEFRTTENQLLYIIKRWVDARRAVRA